LNIDLKFDATFSDEQSTESLAIDLQSIAVFPIESRDTTNSEPDTPDGGFQEDRGVAVVEKTSDPKTKKPPMYSVVLVNDDYTPMEFVVTVLEQFFGKNRISATKIMLEVHTKGKGVCAVYPYDIAKTKVYQVNQFARQNQHPLLCTLEKTI